MEMNIRDYWEQISPATQQWLTDHPGCLILPRTVTETIRQQTGQSADCDQHGLAIVTPEDLGFIHAKGQ
jgi:hypothetical protein